MGIGQTTKITKSVSIHIYEIIIDSILIFVTPLETITIKSIANKNPVFIYVGNFFQIKIIIKDKTNMFFGHQLPIS